MQRKPLFGLFALLVIPLAMGAATIVNSLQEFVQIPLWLSSLVGAVTLAAGTLFVAVRGEENERHAEFLHERERLTHNRKCDGSKCLDPGLHKRKPFVPKVRRE